MSGITSPAIPPFSYAQAAKGMSLPATTSHTTAETPSQKDDKPPMPPKAPDSEPPNLDLASKSIDPPSTTEKATPEEHKHEQTRSDVAREGSSETCERSAKRPHSSEREPSSTRASSSPNSVPTSTQPTSTSDEASTALKGSSDSTWDEQSQTSTFLEKPTANTENDKDLDEEAQQKEKRNSSAVDPELKAAPIPAVNIWQERQKAQEAKAQANATLKTQVPSGTKSASAQSINSNIGVKSGSGKSVSGPRSEEREGMAVGREKRLTSDGSKAKEEPRKVNPRVGRQTGDAKAFTERSGPPSVADATMWPTPENAIFEEKKKPQNLDRSGSAEIKSPAPKAHGKKQWEHVPHVPTVKFNTPLPPAATRRGGKGPSRGRDGTTRGGHTPSSSIGGEKPAVMGPPPVPKQDSQRGRNDSQSENMRANSFPGPGRRATSADAATAEHRRSAPINQVEQRRPENKNFPDSKANDVAVAEVSASKPRTNSRPLAKGSGGLATPTHRTSFNNGTSNNFSGDAQTYPRYSSERRSAAHDLFKDTGLGLDRGELQAGKEYFRGRGFNAERNDFGREKVDSWRDREPHNDRPERRDTRPERPARGSHRGRGSHSNFGNHGTPSHAFTAPLPQHPFPAQKSNAYTGDRGRQSSVPYFGQSQNQPNSRNNTRANTVGSSQMYGAPNTLPGMPQHLAPIMTDFGSMYTYPNMPMTAQPYPQLSDPYAILSMVSIQLTYYFSVDNLCKDIFLRKHMDSQGYVPLSFIAGFQRIQNLTEDMTLLRYVCQQSPTIDYIPGEAGNEKVRASHHWNQWVLPMDQRDESAKNDGPADINGFSNMQQLDGTVGSAELESNINSMNSNGLLNGNAPDAIPFQPGAAYGFHVVETPISAAIDEQKPKQTNEPANKHVHAELKADSNHQVDEGTVTQTQSQVQNGTGFVSASPHPQENTFTNQQTKNLTVVYRDGSEEASQTYPPLNSTESRSFSNGSLDNRALGERSYNPGILPTLRGGADSFDHNGLREVTRSLSPSNCQNDHHEKHPPVFWVKDGTPPISLHESGLTHMPYKTLRSKAFAQSQTLGELSPDLEILYQFWSHFLVRNFNADMYDEFHGLALSNGKSGSSRGLKHLLRYYEAALSSQRVLQDKVAIDLVDLVAHESEKSRPAFKCLRASWRNGAFSLKSRKKFDSLITPQLKAELEA